ncbi:DUF4097 family beta strand repeat-containing protein [Streptomyces sp. NPDC050738]|uniref:DUF4097 family beta strand repeat-containing protein n=1 Tax=Streptomyces sp. NPDC050738 TaxID=3154744 RepID=UPI003429DF49
MNAATKAHVRCLAAVLALAPLLAACGGGSDEHSDGQGSFGAAELSGGDGGAHIMITTDNGLRLRPTDGSRATVDQDIDHHWSHHDHTWVLDLTCTTDDDGDRPCPRMPEVDVPDGAAVTVRARNAGIDAAGVDAALDLTTVNGDVVVDGSGRADAPMRLVTRNGSVRTSAVRASQLHAATVNGDVLAQCATSPRHITAATTNGSVDTAVPHDSPTYRVTATTDNGRAYVTLPTGEASSDRTMALTTVNGDVRAHRD